MEIYEVLHRDHQTVLSYLDQLLALGPGQDERRKELIEDIRDELIPHSRAEEAVLYNSLRTLDVAKDIGMHGYQDHLMAETLLRALQMRSWVDGDFKKTALALKEALEKHIRFEEGEAFTMARSCLTPEEAQMMVPAFEKLKSKVREEGFMKTTLDMITNMMPPRFAKSIGLANPPLD